MEGLFWMGGTELSCGVIVKTEVFTQIILAKGRRFLTLGSLLPNVADTLKHMRSNLIIVLPLLIDQCLCLTIKRLFRWQIWLIDLA